MSMRSSRFAATALASALAAAFVVSHPAAAQSLPASAAENSRLWFVELTGKPVADGASLSSVQAEQAKLRTAARAARINFVERRSFNTLFNGLSIEIDNTDRQKLARLSGVRAIYPVEVMQAPTPSPETDVSPDMVAALSLTGAKTAQNSLGLTGQGVKVAIIDSGVDIDHPAFGGTGTRGTTAFPNSRVIAGHDFVGDNFDAAGDAASGQLVPVPDTDPRDCGIGTAHPITGRASASGHGTHVAGIVGANGGGVLGVAPNASLGAYRVFGCWGSTTADIMLAAMERALADGMQVINMSIGARAQWPQYPTGQAASRLAQKGVVVVASIGNNGPGGSAPDALFAAGAPGVGTNVIGVASFDNAQRAFQAAGQSFGFNPASGSPMPPASGSLPMSRTGTTASTADACAALPAGSLAGSAVLIRRGGCTFYAKAFNAQQAGAAAVVLYNNAAGALNATVTGAPPITIPVVGIAANHGAAVDAAIAAGTTTLSWTSDYVSFPQGTGGLISGFSSFGIGADLSVKPNLGAPGGGILSTYPLELGSTSVLSGTSMSSPHVAGAAALILQAIPTAALGRTSAIVGRNAPPNIDMSTRMMNTAKPKGWSGSPLAFTEHAFRQGAGMLDVVSAVQSQQFVVPGQIAAGESEAGPFKQKLTIRNDASTAVTYTLGHLSGVAAGPNTPAAGNAAWALSAVFDAPATVAFDRASVTVPAKGVATVEVTITANSALPDRSLHGGYVTFTPQGAGAALVVPYAGLKGDYQSTQLLRASGSNFPWVASLSGTTLSKCPDTGCTFSMVGAQGSAQFLFQLAHHARTVKLEAFDAATNASRGVISEDHYFGRNATPANNSFSQLSWNGITSQGAQPNGSYYVKLSVLKPLGNAANAAHWESWTSPTFTISRP